MFEGIVIGFVLAALVAGVVVMVVKFAGKKEEDEMYSVTPQEAAAEMTAANKEELIEKYAGVKVPFSISEDVAGQISNLYVDWVEAYGVRYKSIDDALDNCNKIEKEEDYALERFEASLAIVRAERMATRRYLTIHEMLDEEVYVYEPCKMKIDVDSRAGEASRIAINIIRKDTLEMEIDSIYVSKHDVTNPVNRYEFDMTNEDDAESFKLLVRSATKFKDEVAELEKIEKHIARFNELVAKERVGLTDNGDITIYPPSPEEIKAKRAAIKDEVFGSSSEGQKPETTTPEPEEAKQEVDEEFVSSTVLNN